MRGLMFYILILIILSLLFASQSLYKIHQEENITFNIYKYTENNLNWSTSLQGRRIESISAKITSAEISKIQSNRIHNLITKFVDWIGYSLFEVSKWTMEFGYTHPEYDFEYFFRLFSYFLVTMIVMRFIPLIVPLIALIYVLMIAIKNSVIWLNKYLKKLRRSKT